MNPAAFSLVGRVQQLALADRNDFLSIGRKNLSVRCRVTEAIEIVKAPHDFLVSRDFDDLWILFTSMAVADNDVAILQDL